MTEPIGYNNDQFDDLPDEDASWNKMSRLLDKDEDRRRALPFWLGASGLIILLLCLSTGAWMIFSGKDNNADQVVVNKSTQPNPPAKDLRSEKLDRGETLHTNTGGDKTGDEGVTKTKIDSEDHPVPDNNPTPKVEKHNGTLTAKTNMTGRPVTARSQKQGRSSADPRASILQKVSRQKERSTDETTLHKRTVVPKAKPALQDIIQLAAPRNADKETNTSEKRNETKTIDPKESSAIPFVQDPSVVPIADSANKKPSAVPADTSKTKEAVAGTKGKTRNKKPMQWTLGLVFQQPVALGAQGMSDYNYRGRKSFVVDHIPGIYITAGKRKWYAGTEFNYAVPQPVEQIYFSQQTKYSSTDSSLSRERYSVEKIYHHQLLASANYFVAPQFSLGIGGSYNILTGAVTEKELRTTNVNNGLENTVTSLAPVKGYKDSFFFKSTASAILQSEYHWKRVRVGARYTYALQPYMRYTKPDGEIVDVRNNTLQVLVRFQLWKK